MLLRHARLTFVELMDWVLESIISMIRQAPSSRKRYAYTYRYAVILAQYGQGTEVQTPVPKCKCTRLWSIFCILNQIVLHPHRMCCYM